MARQADPHLDELARNAAAELHAPSGAVVVLDHDGGLRLAGTSGRTVAVIAPWCRTVLATRRTLEVPGPWRRPRERLAGSYLGMPIVDGTGAALAVVCVSDDRPRAWDADDHYRLARIGQLVLRRLHATTDASRGGPAVA